MREQYTKITVAAGISKHNRELLDKLNQKEKGPFTISDLCGMLDINEDKARRLASYWVARGWLSRVRRGLFITVPLGAVKPSERKEDPWIVASNIFSPCYIGGWSACEHWGLTEQIFKDIVVFSSRKVRKRKVEVQETTYIVRNIKKEKLFGLKTVWRGQTKANVSDPSRTIVDILNEPYLGGGIRNASIVLKEYFEGESRDEAKILDYISKTGNRTIYKRLGYLIEALKIDASKTVAACKKNISLGYSNLDPSLPKTGKIYRRWNIRINASL
jgi:predicted transcriptional regulator of viral defense system